MELKMSNNPASEDSSSSVSKLASGGPAARSKTSSGFLQSSYPVPIQFIGSSDDYHNYDKAYDNYDEDDDADDYNVGEGLFMDDSAAAASSSGRNHSIMTKDTAETVVETTDTTSSEESSEDSDEVQDDDDESVEDDEAKAEDLVLGKELVSQEWNATSSAAGEEADVDEMEMMRYMMEQLRAQEAQLHQEQPKKKKTTRQRCQSLNALSFDDDNTREEEHVTSMDDSALDNARAVGTATTRHRNSTTAIPTTTPKDNLLLCKPLLLKSAMRKSSSYGCLRECCNVIPINTKTKVWKSLPKPKRPSTHNLIGLHKQAQEAELSSGLRTRRQSSPSLCGTTTSPCSSSPGHQPKKRVSFTDVSLRDYYLTVGDHPGISNRGPSTSLDWEYLQHPILSIDVFEHHRQPHRVESWKELRIPAELRHTILKDAGIDDQEMERAIATKTKVRKQRQVTNKWTKVMPFSKHVELVLESASRKTKRAVFWQRPYVSESEFADC